MLLLSVAHTFYHVVPIQCTSTMCSLDPSGHASVKRCDALTCHFPICWFSVFLPLLLRNVCVLNAFIFHYLSTLNCETMLSKLRPRGPNGVWIEVTELEIFISVCRHSHTVVICTETQASYPTSYRSGQTRSM